MSEPSKYHDDFYDCESTVDAGEDTREKLEEDWAEFYTTHERECLYQSDVGQFVFDLLDRQAAITERQQREWWGGVAAELIAERDEWKAKAEQYRESYLDAKSAADGHWRTANNIAKERDKLRAKVDEHPSGNGLRGTVVDYTERLGEAAKTLHIETQCTYDDLRVLCKTLMGVFE